MSDFLLATRRRPPGELRTILDSYLAPVSSSIEERHGDWGSLAVARASHDRGVLREDGRFLSVLVGEPIVRAPGLPPGRAGDGSLRGVVHERLREGSAGGWDDLLDGAFAALGIDVERGGGVAVSDLAGFITLFSSADAGGEGLVLGTHADAVARGAGRGGELDLVSAVDLIANLSCTYPYTLYRAVEQLPPACVRPFDRAGWSGVATFFWRPVERAGFGSLDEAAIALREAFAEDVRLACGGESLVGLLLSGGEDARAVLGAVPEEVAVRAFTFAGWENREVRVARRVAEIYGAEHVFRARTPTHYLDGFTAMAGAVGSPHLFFEVHGYGFHDRLRIRDLPVVLGGLSSDSFLKGHYAPKKRRVDARFHAPHVPLLRADLVEEMVERRTAFRRWIAEIRPDSAVEWERIWPFSVREHAGNVHGNRRLFTSHEPFHSNAVVKIAASVPLGWKEHRALFLRTMRPFLRRSWRVPHANYRYPYFGRYANVPLAAGLGVARGIRAALTGEIRARQRPWPKWSVVVGSEAMGRLEAAHPALGTPLAEIFASADRAGVERAVSREWHPRRRMTLLQLAYLSELARV